ncbi:hypothetical protein QR98_0060800 [Sarcoptes scabiei]|uniref:Uncharacterized protein n=1 Tax=Sarcoptes scabiei TaxID=52283 RepID=A0A132A9E4_SARSC|nr:hypothetical protein QR98_0060800 [Sarcoptes scabiei]
MKEYDYRITHRENNMKACQFSKTFQPFILSSSPSSSIASEVLAIASEFTQPNRTEPNQTKPNQTEPNLEHRN